MKANKEPSYVVKCTLFLIYIVIGGLLGFSIVEVFGDELQWWELVIKLMEGLFLLILAFFLQVILHEGGHMLAGLLRGWKFISFMILGFVISRREGSLHLSRFAIPGVGGQCLMMPPEEGDTNWGIAFYNAGGVLMNTLVVLLSAVILALYYSHLSWGIDVFLGSLCITGLFFAITNGIPASHGGIPNDGMNICELKKDTFSTYVFLTTMRIVGKLQQGCHLNDVTEKYLTEGVEVDYMNPIHVMAVNFDISLAIARFDFEQAHAFFKRIDAYMNHIVPIYQMELLYEKVFLFLVSPRDGVDVGILIDSDTLKYFEMQTNFRPTALRVKYAFARLYECDEAKASIIYNQFQNVCKTYHIPGEIYSEQKLVEYVRRLTPPED